MANVSENFIMCISTEDQNNDGQPDLLWQKQISGYSYRSAVITDINPADGKGEKEIILLTEWRSFTSFRLPRQFNPFHWKS